MRSKWEKKSSTSTNRGTNRGTMGAVGAADFFCLLPWAVAAPVCWKRAIQALKSLVLSATRPTFSSYGDVAGHRQAEIIRALGTTEHRAGG
jgi:hypothetical protein